MALTVAIGGVEGEANGYSSNPQLLNIDWDAVDAMMQPQLSAGAVGDGVSVRLALLNGYLVMRIHRNYSDGSEFVVQVTDQSTFFSSMVRRPPR
jgi:hypothetical protein